jgi:CheY-like chemotaxis protein
MPFKILVIDDEIHDKTETISGLPALLESAGYEVATTADGETTYDLVFEYKPDLIALDMVFERQDITGIEICRAIRAEEYRTPPCARPCAAGTRACASPTSTDSSARPLLDSGESSIREQKAPSWAQL